MNFRITLRNGNQDESYINDIPIIFQNDQFLIQGDSLNIKWKNKDNDSFFLIGDFLGHRENFKINSKFDNYALLENSNYTSEFEGRYIIVKISQNKNFSLWADSFGRVDVYWCKDKKSNYYITSSMEMIPPEVDLGSIDQNALAQLLTIYGSRPLKKHTLRENVNRLGIGEMLFKYDQKLMVESSDFIPKNTFPKDDSTKLDQYAELFIEAVRGRASETQNIVFLSSGWDSTSILATLNHLYDSSKIECIIGRHLYSKRSKTINQFELDRAKKMADYYGVKLHIVDFDFTEGVDKILDECSKTLKGMEFSNLTGINHWILAKGAAKIAKPGAVVFAGEISDGAHNLGFSQYFSIFHPASHSFREYSDKMASYLFGPTFMNQLIEGKHEQDPVWKIFMEYHSETKFDKLKSDETKIISQLLETFFLSGGRIPLYSKDNCKVLTAKGRKEFLNDGNKIYLNKFEGKVNKKNIYSHYLHLYNSFHWQGGTVATLEYTCDAFGLKCRLPFLDKALIDFLSQMPESWGRGLDINNTKYPLKWMLTHKIDYPMHYQSGPHSYLYDINPSFSHSDEIVNSSSFTPLFRKVMGKEDYLKNFDSDYFDIEYIKKITTKYISGESIKGQELADILNLGNLLILGHLD